MKKLFFALALAVVLNLAITTPVMAKGVVEVPGNATIGVQAANTRTAETPAPLLVCLP